jgi:hypothetical protein
MPGLHVEPHVCDTLMLCIADAPSTLPAILTYSNAEQYNTVQQYNTAELKLEPSS